jgi:selenocysteine-specific elongation factor
MRVIGTAGHVDHGKSTLVQALTGTHPDRLKEEREREMTIDLGFAWMSLPKSEQLPEGEEVGIIDVPGHRDFIENMLAGVGGIDAALFVVAADEGVMPQTREHLSILDILQVEAGVVALTKIDLVDDEDWLELVEEDVRRVLANTVLANAPIVRVSARTRQGLPELVKALSACLAQSPPRPDLGKPRLPVDRVFTIPGFGTVVTGTLVDGSLRIGDEVEVLGGPRQDLRGRVRGLQSHKHKEDIAVPGSRTAVNISGLNVEDIQRGCVIARPGDYQVTRRLDVRFRLLPDTSQPLQHNSEVKMFIGSAERLARVRLLGVEELLPGHETWLQLELEEPVSAARGDRYILRRPSPGETLGGGVVVDSHPKGRYKRFSEESLQRLEALTQGTPTEVFYQALAALFAAPLQDVIVRSDLDEAVALSAAEELRAGGQLLVLDADQNLARPSLVASRAYWQGLEQKAIQEIEGFHRSFPLRKGLAREELKSKLKLTARIFSALLRSLSQQNLVEEIGPLVMRTGYAIRFNPAQQRQVDELMKRFAAAPYSPPTVKDCIAEVKEDIYNALVELGELTPVPPDVVFRHQDYQKMVAEVRRLIQENGSISAAQVRDHFNTSRRYALALLEHLDAIGVTVREGDSRRLKS